MNQHEILAALLRTAINDTLNSLEGLDGEDRSAVMLVSHLGDLLAEEKKLLCTSYVVIESTTDFPDVHPAFETGPGSLLWYPDKDVWFETFGNTPKLDDHTMVEVMTNAERERQQYAKAEVFATGIMWDKVVAYKVVQ